MKTARTSQCGPSWDLVCLLALRLIVDPRVGGPVIVVIAVGGGAKHGPTITTPEADASAPAPRGGPSGGISARPDPLGSSQMRAPDSISRFPLRAGLAAGLLTMFAAIAPAAANSPPPAGNAPIVDCRLPPQIRSLGRNVTYLAAGRLVQVPAAECGQRGGTWSGGGPGSHAGAKAPLAVTVGVDGNGPACPLQATVSGLHSGTLTVRAGPSGGFERVDRLHNGTRVFLCDRSGDAGWAGIVYGSGDCGLSAPIARPRAYSGACRSGWVRSDYLR